MPELPEVEVVRLRLCQSVLQHTIAALRTSAKNYAFLTPPRELQKRLPGRRFTNIARIGKYLLFELDDSSRLLIHLGMTGQLVFDHALNPRLHNRSLRRDAGAEPARRFIPDRHTHMSLTFEPSGEQLHFRDTRKFGKVLWLAPGCSDPRIERLGPDALLITKSQFVTALATRRTCIKSALLDQSTLAGVGNIYADESLYAARIDPRRSACKLSSREQTTLLLAVRRILKQAIVLGGSSIDDYTDPDGSDGTFQKRFAVYGRGGEACRRCGAAIQRIVVQQRGTHYCPRCQT